MASNARFHNKYHRRNHHSIPSEGFPDSGADPIASPQEPFRGDFHAIGALSATGNLTIGGNTLIYGNLSALGDFSVVDTIVTVTSALSVINESTGPALTVQQKGNQPIAIFFDDNSPILQLKNGLRAEFFNSQATNTYALAEGQGTLAQGNASHAEGYNTIASGPYSHAQGDSTRASGDTSHAEGIGTVASGDFSHAQGDTTRAQGYASHAEGALTRAAKDYSHAAGYGAVAAHDRSWIWKGDTVADPISTTRTDQFMVSAAGGVYVPGNVGIGTDNNTNALTVAGVISASGNLTINGNTTLGDSNLDTLTLNGTNVSIPNNLNFDTNTLFIDATNNSVGIGTDAPDQKLHVLKASAGAVAADTNSIAVFEGGGNAHISILTPDAQTGGVVFGSPGDIIGSYLTWNHDNNALKLATAKTNGFIQLVTNNEAEAVRITSSGNVGIATTTPVEKLTVNGNISSNGTVFTTSVTSRGIDIIHAPTNDGVNPILRIGECTPWSTTLSGVSGFQIEYNETTNDLNLSAIGFNTSREALKITSAGNTRINLLSAISPNYDNLTAVTRGISGVSYDNLSHLINGRVGVNNQAPVSSYALHVKGGNIRVDGVDFSAVPGFDGSIYDSDGQSLVDLRSAAPDANYSVSIASSGLNNFIKFFGGRSSDQNPFIAVKKGQPIRFSQFNNFYGQGFSEVARIGGNANVSIGLSADGAERLTVLGNISASGTLNAGGVGNSYFAGNVGIGTDAPDQKLHVLKASAGTVTADSNSIAVFEGGGNAHISILTPDAQTGGVVFGSPGDIIGSYLTWNYGNNALKLATAKTNGFIQLLTNDEEEAVRITSSGNVGIGTTVPVAKLTVNGNISANGSTTTQALSVLKTTAGADAAITILAGNNSGDAASLFFGNSVAVSGHNRGQIRYYNGGVEAMAFSTSTVEAMRIRAGGQIGLGVTTPAEKLTVSGNISANGTLQVTSLTSRGIDLIHTPANDGTNPTFRIGECTSGSTTLSAFSGVFMSYDEGTNVFGISSVFSPAMGVPAISIDRNGSFFTSSNASPKMTLAYAMTSANFLLSATNTTNSYIPLFTVPRHVLYYVPGVDITFTVENFAGGNQLGTDQMPVFRLARGTTGASNQEMSVDISPFTNTNLYDGIGWCRQSTNTQSNKTMALPGDTVYLKVKEGYNNTGGATTAYSILSGRVILTGYYILP